jgi:hypothetical protein
VNVRREMCVFLTPVFEDQGIDSGLVKKVLHSFCVGFFLPGLREVRC